MEWNVILQVQHISNNKYTNFFHSKWQTYTHNETAACIEYYNVKVKRTQFLMWTEKQIDMQ